MFPGWVRAFPIRVRQAGAYFVAAVVLDFAWAIYIRRVAAGDPWGGGIASAAALVLGGFIARGYVRDWRHLVPAALGAFVGTALCVLIGL